MSLIRNAARAWRLLRRQGPVALSRMAVHQSRRAVGRHRAALPFLRDMPPLDDLLGMTTREEQAWLHWYASREYRGEGAIVDLGCWLGASTIALAEGLRHNPGRGAAGARIHAYDRFVWEEWMEDSVAGTALAGRLRPGESFLPEFERRIGPWSENIVPHCGDLPTIGWQPGGPIELLFNDVAKSWSLARSVLRDFYSSLVPGVSLVVEQDFCHYFTPWVHLLQDRLRDYLAPEVYIPYSGSMVFRLTGEIPTELLSQSTDFADFSPVEVERAFATSLALVDPPMRPNVWAARVMWELHQGNRDRARELLAEAPRRGYRGLDLEKVRLLLD